MGTRVLHVEVLRSRRKQLRIRLGKLSPPHCKRSPDEGKTIVKWDCLDKAETTHAKHTFHRISWQIPS